MRTGSVFDATAVNDTLYVGVIVTFVVPWALNDAGDVVAAVSVTDPPDPELAMVQFAVTLVGGSPG